VVAMSETLHSELLEEGINVSVLCPTFFKTNIAKNARGNIEEELNIVEKLMARATIQAEDVAKIALDQLESGILHIVPHVDGRWLGRVKRTRPAQFHHLLPHLLRWRQRTASADTK